MPNRTRPRPAAAAKPAVEPFVLNGLKVRAGERRTVDLPVTDLSTHTPMTMPVQVVHGRRPGPRLFVCAALHGDEIAGVEIIRRLLRLSALDRLAGTLIAVPIVNVFGFVALSRYLPDRRDLNRSFPGSARGSLAGRLANLFLSEIVAKATHGIDLHTGAVHRPNYPQVRVSFDDPEALRMAEAFGVPLVINAGFRDGSLRLAAAEQKVPVIVYEAGEALRFDEAAIRAGVKGVVQVMRGLGMLKGGKSRNRGPDPVLARSSSWVRAPISGILRAGVALGARVEAGEWLGVVSDPFGESDVEVHARDGGVIIGRTNLPVVHEGDALFHIVRVEGSQANAEALDAFEPELDYQQGLTSELTDEPPLV